MAAYIHEMTAYIELMSAYTELMAGAKRGWGEALISILDITELL